MTWIYCLWILINETKIFLDLEHFFFGSKDHIELTLRCSMNIYQRNWTGGQFLARSVWAYSVKNFTLTDQSDLEITSWRMDNDIRLVFSRGSVIDFNSVSEVSVKYSSLGDAIAMTIKRGHGVLMVSLISNLLIGFCLFIQEPFHFFGMLWET